MILGLPWWLYLLLVLGIVSKTLWRVKRGAMRGRLSVTFYVLSSLVFCGVPLCALLFPRLNFFGILAVALVSLLGSVGFDILSERAKKF